MIANLLTKGMPHSKFKVRVERKGVGFRCKNNFSFIKFNSWYFSHI